MLPKTMLPLLAVPGTNQPPRLVVESWAGEEPFSGWLLDRNRQAVARLLNFRFRFVGFNAEAETRAAFHCLSPAVLQPVPQPVPLALDDPRITREGDWLALPGRLQSPGTPGSLLRFTTTAPQVGLRGFTWPNGGILEIRRNGAVVAELDLYGAITGLPTGVTIDNPGGEACELVLAVSGRRNPAAGGTEAMVAQITEHAGPPALPAPDEPLAPLLDEPPMLPPFMDWVAALPPEGRALDIGGSPRRQADPRLLQLDWLAFDGPHLLGDPLALPFRDASMDLVHSNTGINRVADPAGFAREIHRVLKPGGWALIGATPGRWLRYGAPHLVDLTPAALRQVFSGFSECHLHSGGGIADRTMAMLDWTGLAPMRFPRRVERLQQDLAFFEDNAAPGAFDPMALWSILQVRK